MNEVRVQLVRDALTEEALATFDEDVKQKGFKLMLKSVDRKKLHPYWQYHYKGCRKMRFGMLREVGDYVICDREREYYKIPKRTGKYTWNPEKKEYVLTEEKIWD